MLVEGSLDVLKASNLMYCSHIGPSETGGNDRIFGFFPPPPPKCLRGDEKKKLLSM
jgi:hypothetical protein